MPETRTVTGFYRLRPTSKIGYISSGTFSDWFTGDAPASGWTNELNVTNTALGDHSDSTYAERVPNSGASQVGYNMRFWVTPDSDTPVPEWDYSITSITSVIRWAGSHDYGGGTGRAGRIFSTIYDPSTSSQTAKASSLYYMVWQDGNWDNSITNISNTKTYSDTLPYYTKETYPKASAFCMSARKLLNYMSFSWLRCYQLVYNVYYSYVETAETLHFFRDDGCTVSSGGTDVPTADYSTWRYTKRTYTATVKPGYEFDGWYLNGTKVSSNLSYEYEFHEGDKLYCITKVRKIFDGTTQANAVYVGTDAISEIYIGTTKIWGLSDLYDDATGG